MAGLNTPNAWRALAAKRHKQLLRGGAIPHDQEESGLRSSAGADKE